MAIVANTALTNTFDTWRTNTNTIAHRINAFATTESTLFANTLFANTGLYVLNQKISKLIPKNRYYDINHLILRAQKKNLKIGTFLINEKNWVDVGQISDLSKHLSF